MKIYDACLVASYTQDVNKEIGTTKLELSVQLDRWTFSNCL